MPTYRAQVVIPHVNGLVEDAMTNTLHFIDFVPQPLADLADDVTPLIETWYEAMYAGPTAAAGYYSWSASRVKWYDLSQPEPRVPYELPLPMTVTSSASEIPAEVACVVSFQANREPGVPQSRRRGRIYLGGLNSGFIADSTSAIAPMLLTSRITTISTACDAFQAAVAGTSARWAVWSPTDQTASIVTNGWVENAPDTQRRRGQKPFLRVSWSN